jgi:multidrug efflux pump subunit AcrB
MGAIARSAANLITTSGVVLKGAVNNDSFDNVTALPSSFGDGITLISSQTASASASISFTSGIDSTYKAYKFVFSNIHPATDNHYFQFNGSTDSGSTYNVTKTTTKFRSQHDESDVASVLEYFGGDDLAQSTADQRLMNGLGNGNDESLSGELILFNPSSTTYVKHFISNVNSYEAGNRSDNGFVAGYFNTTSAVNAIIFRMGSGNLDDGTIYLYGIK